MIESQIGPLPLTPAADSQLLVSEPSLSNESISESTLEPQLEPELESQCNSRSEVDGLLLGVICGFTEDQPVVAFELDGTLRQAVVFAVVSSIRTEDLGARVCLALAGGDLSRPILLGKIRNPESIGAPFDKLEITHPHEIALRCGKSTVQLKSDGTIAIRGTNVASRATQSNRIRGANVQIN